MSEQNSAHVAYLDELSAQSATLLAAVRLLQENTAQLVSSNQSTAEKSHDEIIALKTARENLTRVLTAERATIQTNPALVPIGKIVDRRMEK